MNYYEEIEALINKARLDLPLPSGLRYEMRTFETGATRSADEDKLDYEGFLSPLAIERFAEYLHKHRRQADGALRASDNWQKGMPLDVYMKSMWRHFEDLWLLHRGWPARVGVDREEALCALMFNVQGYLHELLKDRVPVTHAPDGGGK